MANYLLAGGGTGGHICPGFALAEAIGELDPSARVDFACTTRVIDKTYLETWQGKKIVQPVQPFSLRPMGFIKFYLNWNKTKTMIRSYLKEGNISGVIGLGGFGSGAAVYEARQMGLKTAFLQPDFVPGRANKWLSGYADKIFVQWEGTQQFFDRPVDVVGVPMKKVYAQITGPERARLREEPLKEFELSVDRKTLLITGGSTGAQSLNIASLRAMADFAEKMVDTWQVLHLTGAKDFDRIRGMYKLADKKARVKVLPYSSRMDLAYSLADVAICRAGAITLAELTAATVPSILLPYPYHRDNHQAKNANVLVQAGAAVMVNDDKVAGPQTVEDLKQALRKVLTDDTVRANMVRGAETLRRVDAAQKVARWLTGK